MAKAKSAALLKYKKATLFKSLSVPKLSRQLQLFARRELCIELSQSFCVDVEKFRAQVHAVMYSA